LKYSVDTSALLDCWVRYYPPDVFPSVWEKLDKLIDQGDLLASEEVLIELARKDDAVHAWAQARQTMFWPSDEDVQMAVTRTLASHPKLIDQRKGRSGADPFVIAVAEVHKCAVLTGEKPSNSKQRPKIPDVCNALGIRWVDMLQLFRDQQWKFG
jgi:hypothetical protein